MRWIWETRAGGVSGRSSGEGVRRGRVAIQRRAIFRVAIFSLERLAADRNEDAARAAIEPARTFVASGRMY